jgi:hypothetical protein
VIVQEVVRRAHDCAEAVVSTLVDAVMARLTDHHTIVQVVRAAKLDVFHMMSLGAFKEFVLFSAGVTNFGDRRPAARAKMLLPLQREFLRSTSKFLRPAYHRFSFSLPRGYSVNGSGKPHFGFCLK